MYAPSDDEPVASKDEFFEKLNEVVQQIGSAREIILLGDFNSRTDCRVHDLIIGPFGEINVNDNGERLIDLCA